VTLLGRAKINCLSPREAISTPASNIVLLVLDIVASAVDCHVAAAEGSAPCLAPTALDCFKERRRPNALSRASAVARGAGCREVAAPGRLATFTQFCVLSVVLTFAVQRDLLPCGDSAAGVTTEFRTWSRRYSRSAQPTFALVFSP